MNGKEITDLLAKQRDISKRLVELLAPERINYELIRGDLESARVLRQKVLEENKVIEEQNNQARGIADKIIAKANEEAQQILSSRRGLIVEAHRVLAEIKSFVTSIDKRAFDEHNSKLKNMEKVAA